MSYEENQNNNMRYPMKERMRMLCEISSAMDYLHSRNIVHRDLKCENVLLNKMEQCKLMDFGLARISEKLSKQQTKRIGTSIYMAPEVASGSANFYSEKCDVFSFSIMCYILITGNNSPYPSESEYNIELRVAASPTFRPDVKNMEYFLRPDERWVISITQECWDHDPQKRPSFEKLIELFSKHSDVYKEEVQQQQQPGVTKKTEKYDNVDYHQQQQLEEEEVNKNNMESLRKENEELKNKVDILMLENKQLKMDILLSKKQQEICKVDGDNSTSSSTNSSDDENDGFEDF